MIVVAVALALGGFAMFGLSTDAHHRHWFGGRLTATGKRVARGAAWLALATALVASVAARGWVFGPVLWCGLVMLGAGVSFLFLNFASVQRSDRRGR